jgi:DNA-binding NarL/FixJ family response regulator
MSMETETGLEPTITYDTAALYPAVNRRYREVGINTEYSKPIDTMLDPALAEHSFAWVDDQKPIMEGYIPHFVAATGDRTNFVLQGEEDTLELLADKVAASHPDFVLLDGLLLNGLKGADLIPLILQRDPNIKCIGFSSTTPDVLNEFMSRGAIGAIPKMGDIKHIFESLAETVKNQSVFH